MRYSVAIHKCELKLHNATKKTHVRKENLNIIPVYQWFNSYEMCEVLYYYKVRVAKRELGTGAWRHVGVFPVFSMCSLQPGVRLSRLSLVVDPITDILNYLFRENIVSDEYVLMSYTSLIADSLNYLSIVSWSFLKMLYGIASTALHLSSELPIFCFQSFLTCKRRNSGILSS